jgi:catechol 2,3-dioxygenase-like lactoylglutathione lyase family enzyme
MEAIISNLLSRFECGALSRRGLIQGLAMLAAGGAADAQDAGIKAAKIDHVSIQVNDLPRSIAFYQKMFGLTVVSEDKPNEIVRLGAGKVLVSLHHKSPTGLVDHFALAVEGFNKDQVTQQLRQRGANPEDNLDAGFHIKDPEGLSVQIVGA